MSNDTVILEDLGGGKIAVRPAVQTGSLFVKLSTLLESTGVKLDKKFAQPVVSRHAIPVLIERLQDRGIGVQVDPFLRSSLEREITEIQARQTKLLARLQHVTEAMEAEWQITPMPHQIEGALWLAERRNAILADDPRVGKTLSSLLTVEYPQPLLVIAPKNSKRATWYPWIRTVLPQHKIRIVKAIKDFNFPVEGEAVIVTFQQLPPTAYEQRKERDLVKATQNSQKPKKPRLQEYIALDKLCNKFVRPNTVLIVDEAHRLCGRSLMSTHCRMIIKSILGMNGQARHLTGTPIKNDGMDLYNLLNTTDLLSESFGNRKTFCVAFGGYQGAYGNWVLPDETMGPATKSIDQIGEEVSEILNPIMLRRLFSQIRPDMPAKLRSQHVIPDEYLTHELRDSLNEYWQELLDSGMTVDEVVEYLIDHNEDQGRTSSLRKLISAAKIPYLLEMCDEAEEEGTPLVIAGAHLPPLLAIEKRPGWGVIRGQTSDIERRRIEVAFQKGELIGVAFSIRAGGISLDLSRASKMIFCDREWVPGDNKQAEERIQNVKRENGCVYEILVFDHPLERKVEAYLTRKLQLIEHTSDRVATMIPVDHANRLKAILSSTAKIPQKPVVPRWKASSAEEIIWTERFLRRDPSELEKPLYTRLIDNFHDGWSGPEWNWVKTLVQ